MQFEHIYTYSTVSQSIRLCIALFIQSASQIKNIVPEDRIHKGHRLCCIGLHYYTDLVTVMTTHNNNNNNSKKNNYYV